MARYIDAEQIQYVTELESVGNGQYVDVELAYHSHIDAIPTADVQPVVHAHWVQHEELEDCAYCSNCNEGVIKHFWVRPFEWDYCPNCGAKMDARIQWHRPEPCPITVEQFEAIWNDTDE